MYWGTRAKNARLWALKRGFWWWSAPAASRMARGVQRPSGTRRGERPWVQTLRRGTNSGRGRGRSQFGRFGDRARLKHEEGGGSENRLTDSNWDWGGSRIGFGLNTKTVGRLGDLSLPKQLTNQGRLDNGSTTTSTARARHRHRRYRRRGGYPGV